MSLPITPRWFRRPLIGAALLATGMLAAGGATAPAEAQYYPSYAYNPYYAPYCNPYYYPYGCATAYAYPYYGYGYPSYGYGYPSYGYAPVTLGFGFGGHRGFRGGGGFHGGGGHGGGGHHR